MAKITLPEPWSYITPLVTIDFAAGTHTVDDDVAEAARAAGVTKDKTDGDAAKPGKSATADDPQGE